MPKISVVMPTKDRAEFLSSTISSFLKQSYQDWELIIVDDHSQDNTKEIVKKFSDKRTKYYFLTEGKGIAAGRNFGNKKASGEIIAVADSDDLSYPNRLQITAEFFKNNPNYDIFYGNIDLYYPKNKKIECRWFQEFNSEILKHLNFIPNPASAYTKRAFQKTPGYDSKFLMGEDYDLWLTFVDLGLQFAYTKESLVRMTKHPGSIRVEKTKLHKSCIRQIWQKHQIRKMDPSQLESITDPGTFKYFTSPEKFDLWFG